MVNLAKRVGTSIRITDHEDHPNETGVGEEFAKDRLHFQQLDASMTSEFHFVRIQPIDRRTRPTDRRVVQGEILLLNVQIVVVVVVRSIPATVGEENGQSDDLWTTKLSDAKKNTSIRLTYLQWLRDEKRREKTGNQRDQPFFCFRIAKLDPSSDDDQDGNGDDDGGQSVSNEQAPPR